MRHNNLNELKEIFEYELKTKLSEKAKTSISEQKTLLNCFKYYDINNEGFADESRWINSILRTGITGFSHNDLEKLYKSYVSNPSDSINYQNFCDYIFGRENVGKISYANIRNNKMKNDMRDNNYYIRNNFQNIDLNKYNRNYLNKNREYENVSNKNQGNNYELLIEKLKEKINTNYGMTYYTLIKNLKANEEKLSQTVSLDELSISLQQLHLNISSNDIYELFNYLDSEKIGRISTSDILNLITEPINEKRTIYLVKVFISFIVIFF
jgi:Ca2+-binding EF-hand superfamily protein